MEAVQGAESVACYCGVLGGREAGVGRDLAHGGHGAVLGRAAVGDEETVGGQRRARVLQPLQRVPTERLGQVVRSAASTADCTAPQHAVHCMA